MANSSPREETSAQQDPEDGEDFFSSIFNLSSYFEEDPELNIVPPTHDEVPPENQEMPQENENPPAEARNPITRSGRVSNRKLSLRRPLNMETMSKLFHLQEEKAAKEAGWGLQNFRNECKNQGIKRWPYRKLKSIDYVIEKLQELKEESGRIDKEKLSKTISKMENTREELLRNPNLILDPEALCARKSAQMFDYRKKKKARKNEETSNNEQEN